MDWLEERDALWIRVAENMRDHFHCEDTVELPGASDSTATVGSGLSELKSILALHDAPPFTYARLKDLVELGAEIQQQYSANHGPVYLQAILQLTNVSASIAVFDDFDALLDENTVSGIRLEPVSWIEEQVGLLGSQI